MLGKVVRGGTLYSRPTDASDRVGGLGEGETVRILEKVGNGAWVKVQHNGMVCYTKTYRIAFLGVRLDVRYGYEGWAHKPHGLAESRTELLNEQAHQAAQEQNEDCEDGDCGGCENDTVTISTGVVSEAAILDAGSQGLSEVPGAENTGRGWLEPGSGTLQFADRLFTSRERKAALKANAAGRSAPISQARYAFAQTLARCATAGGVAYCAMQVAMKALG